MNTLTIIIPLHKYNDEVERLTVHAWNSLLTNRLESPFDIMFIGPSDVMNKARERFNLKELPDFISSMIFVENNDETDFIAQVNTAVKNCNTDYFTVLECDDEFATTWFRNFEQYQAVNQDVSVFLPINELRDVEGVSQTFANEPAWANSFSNELGFIDIECLQIFMDFLVNGGIIKTADFNEFGGLKKSMKFAAWYEFLMRMCHNGKKVYVVPKVGYYHTINRDGSMSDENRKTITPEEGAWLVETAKKEYFFKNDRGKRFDV